MSRHHINGKFTCNFIGQVFSCVILLKKTSSATRSLFLNHANAAVEQPFSGAHRVFRAGRSHPRRFRHGPQIAKVMPGSCTLTYRV